MAAPDAAASAASNKKGVAAPPTRPSSSRARDAVVFATGVAAAVLAFLGPASILVPERAGQLVAFPVPGPADGPRTFYDDADLSYALGRRVTDWDAKRAQWLRSRGLGRNAGPAAERVVMVSGSQPEPCRGAGGDHLLLRFLKNKVDYCRLHGIELLYNNAVLEPSSMVAFWAKIPIVRAAMLAHPEAEWVWWVDADAVFTDMDFSLPLAKYRPYNLVLYGWPEEVYLLLMNRERWGDKTYLGIDYYFQGYFAEIVGKLDAIAARYVAVERKGEPALRRRHAEREHLRYAAARNAAVRAVVPGPDGGGQSGWRRPFVTHFTGCNPCGGKRNKIYSREICEDGMRRALGFADDQVLRAYGFRHAAPLNDTVRVLPFDYPAARARKH